MQSILVTNSTLLTHDGGLPAPTVQGPPIVTQAGEAPEGEGAAGRRDVQVVLVEQERNPHTALTLLPRVMEGDGALSLTVLTPVLKLKQNFPVRTTILSVLHTFLMEMCVFSCFFAFNVK